MLYINIKKFKTAHKKGHLYKLCIGSCSYVLKLNNDYQLGVCMQNVQN